MKTSTPSARKALPVQMRLSIVRKPTPTFLDALSRLMESVGMRRRKPRQMAKAIRHSILAVAAYTDGRLAGFGRLISDRTYYGSLWDIAVSPDSQRRGIGTRIVGALMEEAQRRRLIMVGLVTDSINDSFYARFGFTALPRVHAMRARPAAGRSRVRRTS